MDKFIEIKNIDFKYKRGRQVFRDFSIDFDRMETTIIRGPNGSGKTTLTKLIMGILKAQSGSVAISGRDTRDLSLGEIGQSIGYLFQYPERQLFATSVIEELTFPLLFRGVDREEVFTKAEEWMEIFELEGLRDSYPFSLSYGEKRRLALAAVLMNEPTYLILDEPTASLDRERIGILEHILEKLKKKKIGAIIVSHDLDFIEDHGDRIVSLEGGVIASDRKKKSRS